jgi:hypothetical protein
MEAHEGGCLCAAVRYRTVGKPLRVTVCHCRFCQRATGSAYMVEPIFPKDALEVTSGTPKVYRTRSEGSGKWVHVHFCDACGTKLFLTFERFETSCGVYAGTFDDPNWFEVDPANTKHIFIDAARQESLLPANTPVFGQHAILNDGTPLSPLILHAVHKVSDLGPET